MRLLGSIVREGTQFAAKVPFIGLTGTGSTHRAAASEAARAVAREVRASMPDRALETGPGGTDWGVDRPDDPWPVWVDGGRMEIRVPPMWMGLVVAMALRRRRVAAGLSLADAALRLGKRSRNAYARYEQGRAVPTLLQLDRLLACVGADGAGIGLG
jgi:hypothetical protein